MVQELDNHGFAAQLTAIEQKKVAVEQFVTEVQLDEHITNAPRKYELLTKKGCRYGNPFFFRQSML